MTCSFDIQLGKNIMQEPLFYTKPGTQRDRHVRDIYLRIYLLNTVLYSRDTTQGNGPRGTSLIKAIFTIHRIAFAPARKPYQ